MQRILFVMLALALAIIPGCATVQPTADGETQMRAEQFIRTQPIILEQVGTIDSIKPLASMEEGRTSKFFGIGAFEKEQWVFDVRGSAGEAMVSIDYQKRGKGAWEVDHWHVMSTTEAETYRTRQIQ